MRSIRISAVKDRWFRFNGYITLLSRIQFWGTEIVVWSLKDVFHGKIMYTGFMAIMQHTFNRHFQRYGRGTLHTKINILASISRKIHVCVYCYF